MRVAICGGIGSGKSSVTAILRELGAKVVVADEINASLLLDPSYIQRIANIFPTAVDTQGINKKELASIVYADEGKRRALMDIAHPMIFDKMFAAYPDEPIVFYEIPLLSESPAAFDQVWFVDASLTDRTRRVMIRDGRSEDEAKRIISLQRAEESWRDKADVVLSNVGDLNDLRSQVNDQYCSILRHVS